MKTQVGQRWLCKCPNNIIIEILEIHNDSYCLGKDEINRFKGIIVGTQNNDYQLDRIVDTWRYLPTDTKGNSYWEYLDGQDKPIDVS
jgi:hypothetical protein